MPQNFYEPREHGTGFRTKTCPRSARKICFNTIDRQAAHSGPPIVHIATGQKNILQNCFLAKSGNFRGSKTALCSLESPTGHIILSSQVIE